MSDAWQRIVGVPLDAWIAADTPSKFANLLEQRDNPQPCTVAHRNARIRTVRTEPCNGVH